MKKVAIIMGSDSDLPIVKKAIDTLELFNVPVETHIFSAHRTPNEAAKFSRGARKSGFGVIIAAAGMAAHLAGAIAANTTTAWSTFATAGRISFECLGNIFSILPRCFSSSKTVSSTSSPTNGFIFRLRNAPFALHSYTIPLL